MMRKKLLKNPGFDVARAFRELDEERHDFVQVSGVSLVD
jgi:hypothetical protein